MKHELKILPEFYFRVADGSKTFEIRVNDRAFQCGDTVILREWDPTSQNPSTDGEKGYTLSPALEFKIGFIYNLNDHKKNTVVFSLVPIKTKK